MAVAVPYSMTKHPPDRPSDEVDDLPVVDPQQDVFDLDLYTPGPDSNAIVIWNKYNSAWIGVREALSLDDWQ